MQYQRMRALALCGLLTYGLTSCLARTHTVTLDAETARLEFGVAAVQLEAGDASIVDFCIVLNDSICGFAGGEAVGCGLDIASSTVTVFCTDPILAEWPNTWTLTSATWSAPSIPASGTVLVESAFGYILPSGAGIVTDPGYSAYVLRLDLDTDFGPADVDFTLQFDHGNDLQVLLKAVEVAVAELQSPAGGKVLLPLGDPVIDFPNLPPDNIIDIGAEVGTESKTWGNLKAIFAR